MKCRVNKYTDDKLRNVIGDLIHTNMPPPYLYNEPRQTPFHTDTVLNQHVQSVEMSQRSRQQPATSSNNPESAHEPKGPAGRPRDHGVPTETRTDPLWWNSQPTGLITTQLSNMVWRTPHSEHVSKHGARAKRLSREHYLNELYFLLGELSF